MTTELLQNEDFTIVTKGGGKIIVPNVVAEPQFNPISAYAVNEKVWYGSMQYICTAATTKPDEGKSNPTPEEDTTHWTEIPVEELAKKSESVPTTRTINGQSLDKDVTLSGQDIAYNTSTTVSAKLSSVDSRITAESTTRANADNSIRQNIQKIDAALEDKADDSAVVHKSGDEMTGGLTVLNTSDDWERTHKIGISLDVDRPGAEYGVASVIARGDVDVPAEVGAEMLNSDGSLYSRVTIDPQGVFWFKSQYYVGGEVGIELPRREGILALAAEPNHTGNLAALDANGNPTDSGILSSRIAEMRDKLDLNVYEKVSAGWAFTALPEGSVNPYSSLFPEWDSSIGKWNLYDGGTLVGMSGASTQEATDIVFMLMNYPQIRIHAMYSEGGITQTSDTIAKKSEVDTLIPLLFTQYYPDGSVKSAAEFTSEIKYNEPDTTARTITVKPFCNIDGTAENDNSNLVGSVVIPPFVDKQGNPYINDDGTRYKVVSVGSGTDSNNPNENLTAVIAPSTVTNIEDKAFRRCTKLKSASIPAAMSIGGGAFNTCSSLVSVSLPAATRIGTYAFNACTKLVSVSLPAVTRIDSWAFYNCTSLASVSLPVVTRVDGHVFDGCIKLVSVSLPVATTIGGCAFYNCTSLASVSLPAAFSVDGYTFYNCTSLESVDFGATLQSVSTLGSNAFNNVPKSCKIIVPDEQYDDWIAASNWSTLVTRGYKFLKHSEWESARRYETRLTPTYSDTPTYSKWTFSDVASGVTLSQPYWYEGGSGEHWVVDFSSSESGSVYIEEPPDATLLTYDGIVDGVHVAFTATRVRTDILGYQLGSQTDKPLQPQGDYVAKSDATLTPIYSDSPTFSEWTGAIVAAENIVVTGLPYYQPRDDEHPESFGWYLPTSQGDVSFEVQDIGVVSLSINKHIDDWYLNYTVTRTRTDILGYHLGSQSNKPIASADQLLFEQYYPDGNVKSVAEFTQNIKYDIPDEVNRTITVKSFCDADQTAENDNSNLVGRVVIPPFVDKQGNPYISDDGARYKVIGVSDGRQGNRNRNLTAIIAPNTVTTIGNKGFYYCTALASLSLPAVTTIQTDAFTRCNALNSVSLPAVTAIEADTFYRCIALASLSLPAVTRVDDTFYKCVLSSVDFGDIPRSSVPTLGENAFSNVPVTCKIIVPYAQYDAWIAADGWKDLPQEFVRHIEKADNAKFVRFPVYNGQNQQYFDDSAKDEDDPTKTYKDTGTHRWTATARCIAYFNMQGSPNQSVVRIVVNDKSEADSTTVFAHTIYRNLNFANRCACVPLFLNANDKVYVKIADNALTSLTISVFYI